MNAVTRAVELAGGQSAVARALSQGEETLTPQAVGHWCRKSRVPAERVLQLANLTSGQVSPNDLRPDLYPMAA